MELLWDIRRDIFDIVVVDCSSMMESREIDNRYEGCHYLCELLTLT